jgi:hypothetical protein
MSNHMPTETASALMATLQARFAQNPQRHAGISWELVAAQLAQHPEKLKALQAMETTGGEPDVVQLDSVGGAVLFMDCAKESPAGRRSLCYDAAALESRKTNKPTGSALQMAQDMGVDLLDEAQYHFLQTLGSFDTKTSSWVRTAPPVRQLGGALFGDHRFGRTFIYHNGAESYYGARGFRAYLWV